MSASPTSLDAAPGTPSRRTGGGLVIAVLALCGTVVSLQQTMVLPLVPELPALIGTSTGNASWMVTATLVAGAVATPVISRMADMYGKRRMILVTLAIVALGALVGAFATTLPLLLLARALQGMGMALVPVGIATMRDELDPDRVPLAVALMSATLAIGAGVGLPLGGYLAEAFDWHVVLWLPGVLALVMLALVLVTVTESSVRTAGAFDHRGAVLLSLALVLLLLAVSKGSDWGWTDARTLTSVAAGVALLAVFVPLELRIPNPLVDIRTAAQPVVMAANAISVFMGFAMFVNMLVSTQLLQTPTSTGYGLGLDALHAGLWMAPSAAAFGLLAPLSGWVTRRFGPELAIGLGGAIMTISYLARIPLSGTVTLVVLGTITVTIGTALAYSALPTLIMRSVPVTETAAANGLNTLLRSVGTSSASAVTAAVLAASVSAATQGHPSFGALQLMFVLAASAAAVSTGVIVPFLRRRVAEGETQSTERLTVDHVVRGRVVDPQGRGVPGAIVTVLGGRGSHMDWAHTDSAGDFSVATGGRMRHLFVVSAIGWAPVSAYPDLSEDRTLAPFVVGERLTVSGRVTDEQGHAAADASVVITRRTGGSVSWVRTDADGSYALPLPREGGYDLTAVDRASGATASRLIAVGGRSITLDLQLVAAAQPGSLPQPVGSD
ncbi:MFS transporter [Janibacter terrae]|uniref:MFS transporter n=1 Tax=Janibacter terrae TaxID=103817 RepID=A0ABZ2FAI9_9MICO|nr:MFS transporter [Janibacter terrae]